MNRYKVIAAATFALLLLAACGTSGNGGGIGDIFGGGTPANRTYDIRGTVDSVDQNGRSIVLTNVSGTSASLNPGGGSSVRVYYDDRTTIDYQGRTYRPSDLERGDEVSVRADDSGNHLLAQTMNVTYNSRGGMASSTNGTYGNGSVVHGTVRSVDTYRRTISIDRGARSYLTVEYNASTPVSLNGRSYAPTDLEAGDEIDVRTSDLGSGRVGAQDITVTRTVNGIGTTGSSGSSSSTLSTIRGTVRSVDRSNRTIELDNTSWSSNFQTNSGTRTLVHYDPNTSVDYNGQLYPVTNLERGDVVDVQVQNMGSSNYLAQRIALVRNVNAR
ncbi:MAG: DUF5666 domain-containing protein [Acidobacteriota bacterium]|nr:DUF5666 domain-containing protein [Acidobacteriota bacterium]